MTINLNSKIMIAGRFGMVGSAIWNSLESSGFKNLVGPSSKELDYCDRNATLKAFSEIKPEAVFVAAAKVGGIIENSRYPVEFLEKNLRIQTNIFEASHLQNVDKLLFLGSSCIYPKLSPQPIQESSLLSGPLEPTNEAYAIAKIAGVVQVQSYRKQYERHWISAMPTNLYGEKDNFDLESSHVLPGLIHKFHNAKTLNNKSVILWGDGTPKREFLHVRDLASACVHLMNAYDESEPVNIGFGSDVEISELAQLIKEIVGFQGVIEWDSTKPNGTPRKLLDSSNIRSLGWEPKINLYEGIQDTYQWFLKNIYL